VTIPFEIGIWKLLSICFDTDNLTGIPLPLTKETDGTLGGIQKIDSVVLPD
jgi:hypothetical protein